MMTAIFEIFNPIGSISYVSTRSVLALFLHRKIGFSLLYLVPEIRGPKLGKIFHQNVLFNSF